MGLQLEGELNKSCAKSKRKDFLKEWGKKGIR